MCKFLLLRPVVDLSARTSYKLKCNEVCQFRSFDYAPTRPVGYKKGRYMRRLLAILFLFFATAVHAQKWFSGESDDKNQGFAGTVNESGGILAQYCDYTDANCYWTMTNNATNCDAKESYPAMVNSDDGALHVNMYCYKAGGKSRMAFKNFDEIDGAIRKGKNMAIVVPLDNGGFRVSRFELLGALNAINAMRDTALRKTRSSTKDRIL